MIQWLQVYCENTYSQNNNPVRFAFSLYVYDTTYAMVIFSYVVSVVKIFVKYIIEYEPFRYAPFVSEITYDMVTLSNYVLFAKIDAKYIINYEPFRSELTNNGKVAWSIDVLIARMYGIYYINSKWVLR